MPKRKRNSTEHYVTEYGISTTFLQSTTLKKIKKRLMTVDDTKSVGCKKELRDELGAEVEAFGSHQSVEYQTVTMITQRFNIDRETDKGWDILCVHVCVCVCVWSFFEIKIKIRLTVN